MQEMQTISRLIKETDKIYGYDADERGFLYLAQHCGISFAGKKVLILGGGATGQTAKAAAEQGGASETVIISRSGKNNYGNLDRHYDADIIINTTPVGMFPDCDKSPVDLTYFPMVTGVLDVIYNPLKTALILQADSLAIPCSGGLPMLIEHSLRQMSGGEAADERIEEILRTATADIKNIVLIGMPGSGKTTIGKALAQLLGRKFIDTDDEIVRKAHKSIPQIFEEGGEEAFRKIENEVISELSKNTGCVIATGGGCVLKEENLVPLRQNSLIYWLRRDTSLLPIDGRPLSQSDNLDEMLKTRTSAYMHFADGFVNNAGSVDDTAQKIAETFLQDSSDL